MIKRCPSTTNGFSILEKSNNPSLRGVGDAVNGAIEAAQANATSAAAWVGSVIESVGGANASPELAGELLAVVEAVVVEVFVRIYGVRGAKFSFSHFILSAALNFGKILVTCTTEAALQRHPLA